MYTITIFKNYKATNGLVYELTFDEFVEKIKTYYNNTTQTTTKQTAKGFIAGKLLNDQRVKDTKIEHRSMLVLDLDKYDADITSLQNLLHVDLQYYTYFCYSTASHTKQQARVRIILPLQAPLQAEEYRNCSKNFVESTILVRYIDECSYKPNQIMFLPFYHAEQYFYKNEGDLLDISSYYKEEERIKTIVTTNHTTQQLQQVLDGIDATNLTYEEWLKVGMALHHASNGSEEGLQLWIDFSKTNPKYTNEEKECTYRYRKFISNTPNAVTIGTLKRMSSSITSYNHVQNASEDRYSVKLQTSDFIHYDMEKKACKVYGTYENFKTLLDKYHIDIKYDVIKKEMMSNIENNKLLKNGLNQNVEENLSKKYAVLKSIAILNKIPSMPIEDYVQRYAFDNQFNSFEDYILSKEWDQQDRLEQFYDTVQVASEHDTLKKVYLKKWLLQVLHLTCFNNYETPKQGRNVLVFQGEQNKGKTTWFTKLMPYNAQHFLKEGERLDTNSDMSKLASLKHVIVELGELDATFSKSDIASLKNFLSLSTDQLNRKYDRAHSVHRRRTSFFGTVNPSVFLHDPTGSSRFWCLPVLSLDINHNVDMHQLYRQLYDDIALNNTSYFLTEEEQTMQIQLNEQFSSQSTLRERFDNIFDTQYDAVERRPLYQILELLGYDAKAATKQVQNELISILQSYNLDRNGKGYRIFTVKQQGYQY